MIDLSQGCGNYKGGAFAISVGPPMVIQGSLHGHGIIMGLERSPSNLAPQFPFFVSGVDVDIKGGGGVHNLGGNGPPVAIQPSPPSPKYSKESKGGPKCSLNPVSFSFEIF